MPCVFSTKINSTTSYIVSIHYILHRTSLQMVYIVGEQMMMHFLVSDSDTLRSFCVPFEFLLLRGMF